MSVIIVDLISLFHVVDLVGLRLKTVTGLGMVRRQGARPGKVISGCERIGLIRKTAEFTDRARLLQRQNTSR